MPLTVKSKEPVAIAQTPEFKALQDKVNAAKTVLDEVMTAIAALESKAPPAAPAEGTWPDTPVIPNSGSNNESVKYSEDATLARIIKLTGK